MQNTTNNKMALSIAGCVLLVIGCFVPLFSVSFLGNLTVDFYSDGEGDGVLIIILTVISAIIVFARRFKWLFIPGGLSLAIIVYDFFNMQSDLAGDELASALIQTEWGWLLLFGGAGLVLVAAALDMFGREPGGSSLPVGGGSPQV